MKRNATMNQPHGGRGWLLALVLGLLSCMVMGLVLTPRRHWDADWSMKRQKAG